ncbi:uncharacterized protein MAM_01779 [Metarhizium album ARSEF 1941]|uniref:Uncharacterized protein n=1 Tax=Metarhizium album (strain ARSEF 1941) TaxID=1081103 RepID=A0A0B2X3G9_METAS|nr:uncharacterized protein MAM_01779 [Metarhizium album ARSEF 1941]KHN99855.1 hypothetical protein MAM_01779 [Metarhizium album ARSEF 1941]
MAEAQRDEVIERVIAVVKRRRQREQERVARALQVPAEEYRELPPVQKPVSDDKLPLQSTFDLGQSYDRYRLIFESASTMQLEIPVMPVAEPLQGMPTIPWIIEAPLNSVEVLEAILKPLHPFQIYTARHVQRRFDRAHGSKRLYSEYIRLQGQLERNREIWTGNMHMLIYSVRAIIKESHTSLSAVYQLPLFRRQREAAARGVKVRGTKARGAKARGAKARGTKKGI